MPKHLPSVSACMIIVFLLAACGSKKSGNPETMQDTLPVEEYHADYDIAMMVRSIADAFAVGEPLDTTESSYECVFTDGQGSPLYTNLHGMPGKWTVDVVSPKFLTIRNSDLGDLMAEDLEKYLVANLGMFTQCKVDSLSHRVERGYTTDVFDFGSGLLQFETHVTTTPTGIEAPIVVISMSTDK